MVEERSSSLARLWVARTKLAPELAKLGEHGLVVDAGHGLHLVDDDEGAAALVRGEGALLADDCVDEVEEGGPDEGGHVAPGASPGRVETSRMPPSRIVLRRSTVERG